MKSSYPSRQAPPLPKKISFETKTDQTHPQSIVNNYSHVPMASLAEKSHLRQQRLSEGLCPECGTRLYKVVKARRQTMNVKTFFRKDHSNEGSDSNVKLIPLTLPGVVERGQCVNCGPSEGEVGIMGGSNVPAVKAVPVTVNSPTVATYAQETDFDNEEDLLGMLEAEAAAGDSLQGMDNQFSRSDTCNSIYSTDTEYEDVPLLDFASMDLHDSHASGMNYDRSNSTGFDDVLAAIPDHELDTHLSVPEAANMPHPDELKMPSKPQALDCPDGMSPEVFYQLPPEVQQEIAQNGPNVSDGDIDPDILASLPEHLRQEVSRGNSDSKPSSVSFAADTISNKTERKGHLDRKSLSKSTTDFLSEYEIGEDDFDKLDEDVQNDLLAEKNKLSIQKEKRRGRTSLNQSTRVFLADFDITEEDFDHLDEDVKKGILSSKPTRPSLSDSCVALAVNSKYDPEMLESLPEDLRNELLEEERLNRENEQEKERSERRSVGAHCVNIPAGYDPDTFEALPLEVQQELIEAANDGVVYSADGYPSDSIARAPVVTATATRQEKATYEGDYNAIGKRHGEGMLTWANGDIYIGWFKNGFMEGKGTITFHDGTEYAGQWEKNKFHGNGTRRFKNGNVYNGNYVNGRRHGQGKCHFSNGDLYSGDWKNDIIQGFGRYYYNNGHCFEGMFRNGMRNGRGKYQLTDGRVEIYRYVNDNRVGDGVRWSADRRKAWKMNNGKVVKRISMDDAKTIANRCGPILEDS